jgi:type VI secretion system secreted protein VgrG
LAGFDFKNPRPQTADLPVIGQQGDVHLVESYEYTGGYGFMAGDSGNAQARRRIEEIEAAAKHFEASGNDRTAQPGRWFRLTGHFDIDPYASGGPDSEFLILEVRHSASNNYQTGGGAPAHYGNSLTCVRKAIPWRPGRGYNSTEPKLYGLQTATVVGPAGEEIHTDEFGRVRVQFHWDRAGQFDDKSSAWVRVATPWAGSNFGMTSIPRIGTEVIVQFLDGNPDRPLITGMVPNAHTMPPWPLPDNKTQSGILSRSTPGGAYSNANAIRFEDKKGAEQLWLHAEKDQLTDVEHD